MNSFGSAPKMIDVKLKISAAAVFVKDSRSFCSSLIRLKFMLQTSMPKFKLQSTKKGPATVDKDANTQFGGYFFQNGGTTINI